MSQLLKYALVIRVIRIDTVGMKLAGKPQGTLVLRAELSEKQS